MSNSVLDPTLSRSAPDCTPASGRRFLRRPARLTIENDDERSTSESQTYSPRSPLSPLSPLTPRSSEASGNSRRRSTGSIQNRYNDSPRLPSLSETPMTARSLRRRGSADLCQPVSPGRGRPDVARRSKTLGVLPLSPASAPLSPASARCRGGRWHTLPELPDAQEIGEMLCKAPEKSIFTRSDNQSSKKRCDSLDSNDSSEDATTRSSTYAFLPQLTPSTEASDGERSSANSIVAKEAVRRMVSSRNVLEVSSSPNDSNLSNSAVSGNDGTNSSHKANLDGEDGAPIVRFNTILKFDTHSMVWYNPLDSNVS